MPAVSGDYLTRKQLNQGFTFQGEKIRLVDIRKGIWKPHQMQYLLSVKTVSAREGKGRYADQSTVRKRIFEQEDSIDITLL